MGLLDDAIREHLDLKRRRGADPAEVERLAREALGPVRRGPDDPAQALAEPDHDYPPPAPPETVHPDAPSNHDDEWEAGSAQPAGEEPFDDEYDDYDDEYDDEPQPRVAAADQRVPPPAAAVPPPAAAVPPPPEPVRFVEHPNVPPPPDDQYEPSTAEFFENVPSAQEHLRSPVPPPAGSDETVEYDVERAMAVEEKPPAPPSDEDVLEETPEFFSETPDHDRLWFEQRPPRDFDFDG